jgi:hypothetical protein
MLNTESANYLPMQNLLLSHKELGPWKFEAILATCTLEEV